MARMFCVKVYEGVVPVGTTVFSDPMYNSLLGSADQLRVQVNPEGGAGTLNVALQDSNDNVFFTVNATITSAVITVGTAVWGNSDNTRPMGGFARLSLSFSAGGTAGPVSLWACGRSTE